MNRNLTVQHRRNRDQELSIAASVAGGGVESRISSRLDDFRSSVAPQGAAGVLCSSIFGLTAGCENGSEKRLVEIGLERDVPGAGRRRKD